MLSNILPCVNQHKYIINIYGQSILGVRHIDVTIGMIERKTLSFEEDYGKKTIHWKQGSFLGWGGDREQAYWDAEYSLSPGTNVRVFKQISFGQPAQSITINSDYQYGHVDGKLILVHHDKEQWPYEDRFCYACRGSWSSGEYLKNVK